MPLLCLVPTPLRASRVARRLCDAQEGVLFGRQAITFDALAAGLVAASGDRRPILDPLGERLLAVEVGRAAGEAFATLGPAEGLAGALASALAELRRGEVTAEEALAAAGTLTGAARDRLELAAAALAGWELRLDELGLLDRAAALRAAATAARRRVVSAETEDLPVLLLDGFAALSPAEWDLFAALAARAGSVRVHLPHFADRPQATAAAEALARRVESLHELAAARSVEVLLDRTDAPSRSPRIAAMVAAMVAAMAGGDPAAPSAGEGGVVGALAAMGEAGEARAVAAAAAERVDAGMAPEELRVFSPSPGADADRLAHAFREVGLPFSAGRGPPVREVPVVRLLREALDAAGGPSRRGAERLARSSYLALGGPVEGLELLLDRAGAIDGRRLPAEALRRRGATLGAGGGRERSRLAQAGTRLERLRSLLAPLDEPATARRHASRLAAFVDAAGIRRRAAGAEREVAERDRAALAKVAEAAEQAVRALSWLGRGEATLARRDWLQLLDAALGGATLSPAGEPFGGAVELCGLDDAPGESARGALLVGCGRGLFPVPPAPEPLLREPERQAICAQLRRPAVATASSLRSVARHRALCAAAAGREAVLFAWQSGEGPLAPLVETGLAAAGAPIPAARSPDADLATARSPRELLLAAVRRSRGADAPASQVTAAIGAPLGLRLSNALERGDVEVARRALVDARDTGRHAGEVAAGLLAERLPAEWTPSQLEEFARCPYRFFMQQGLGLQPREGAGVEIDPRDEGSLLHAILERFVAARVARGAWPPSGDAADGAEAMATAEETFSGFDLAGRTGDPAVWSARRHAVRARLARWIELEVREADGLVPRLLEHRFGGDSGRPPLRFGEGAGAVAVKGRIDRVDADGRRLLVLDYKNARASADRRALLDPATFGVTSFQIPIYLVAAARELPGREELGATLALLRDGKRLDPFRAPGAELAGPLGASLDAAVVETVSRIRSGRFPIVSRDCERCDFGAVCRFQGVAEVEEEREGGGAEG